MNCFKAKIIFSVNQKSIQFTLSLQDEEDNTN